MTELELGEILKNPHAMYIPKLVEEINILNGIVNKNEDFIKSKTSIDRMHALEKEIIAIRGAVDLAIRTGANDIHCKGIVNMLRQVVTNSKVNI